ncbi:acyl carrier protein [Peptoniphilus sp. GNH]|nr:acyl carrier protein [Clostridiales bacterium KA00134]UHR03194.1 acyl carrier protein [Peptoniphilus sp. GNH]
MKERVLEIIAEQFNRSVDELTPDINFVNDLEADSIELVELVMNLEDEFEMEIPDDKFENFQTIGDVLAYIEEIE